MDSIITIAIFGGLMLFGLIVNSTNLILLSGFLLVAVVISERNNHV